MSSVSKKALFFFVLLSFGFALFVSVFSLESLIYIPRITDKHVHCGVYLLVSFFLALLISGSLWKKFLFAMGIAFLFGFGMEVLQLFVPGRAFEWGDVLANLAGAFLGGGIGSVLSSIQRKG